ncbi:MAG TPA: hypothetical protein VG186_11345 [Solirubrobacteraceae bacterium]|jgi:hypothetical protein|nr:hypothetical protein [Solirubrobacteraceae bacterium]
MTALVACETVLLVLLVVLVAGLLRSHAEILRRLGAEDTGAVRAPASAAPAIRGPEGVRRAPGAPAPDVAGTTPEGGAIKLSFASAGTGTGRGTGTGTDADAGGGAGASPTLLAFLSSGCTTCQRFWEDLGGHRLPADVGLLVVTHGADRESPSRLRSLTPPGVTVVMSSEAFAAYDVPGAPYFVLVDGSVRGEGVATTWSALESLLTDAIEDAGGGGGARADRIEARLAAAGIAPGDPSLHPSSGATETPTPMAQA